MNKLLIEEIDPGHGLRARGKRERRRRLREAAREVIFKRGYEGATTREIAARADIAIGTLFVYATEKRDLLFLIINDDLDSIAENSVRQLAADQPLMKQLLAIFRPIYKYFEHNVVIGRYAIHEIFLLQVDDPEMLGPEAKRVVERRQKLRRAIADVFDRMKSSGRLSTSERGDAIAELCIWLHWCNIQSWLSEKAPRAVAGEKKLHRILSTLIHGLGPKAGAV